MSTPRLRLCFVCLGNICRSPTAEGVMRHLVSKEGLEERFELDSAGTAAYHAGEQPDERAVRAARIRGIRLVHDARPFRAEDYERFDLVLAMDRANLAALARGAPSDAHKAKIALLRGFDPTAPRDAEVPDPYYGGADGFEEVLDIAERACTGLLAHIRREHGF